MHMIRSQVSKLMYYLLAACQKINNSLNCITEDLDVEIQMYNLTVYSKNYSKILGSLWNYYRGKPNRSVVGDVNTILFLP